eukprot:scaffold315_cov251-Pinguiococcus_pyrenoidosus.AAC.5
MGKDKDEEPNDDEAWRTRRLALGTPVTKESFQAWRVKYDEETGEGDLEVEDPTPSGKQIFLMAQQEGQDMDVLDDDGEEAGEEGTDGVGAGDDARREIEVDEELFGDEDYEDDLDDLDDLDDDEHEEEDEDDQDEDDQDEDEEDEEDGEEE